MCPVHHCPCPRPAPKGSPVGRTERGHQQSRCGGEHGGGGGEGEGRGEQEGLRGAARWGGVEEPSSPPPPPWADACSVRRGLPSTPLAFLLACSVRRTLPAGVIPLDRGVGSSRELGLRPPSKELRAGPTKPRGRLHYGKKGRGLAQPPGEAPSPEGSLGAGRHTGDPHSPHLAGAAALAWAPGTDGRRTLVLLKAGASLRCNAQNLNSPFESVRLGGL